MVNESGASIYSASDVAREEFPDNDITVRGAVSIGRRLMDPLAELVKLDPKSIGVGQYQHDVDQNALKRTLDDVVVSCVNNVGVELNTASKHLLTYVSGLNARVAANIVAHRDENGPFKSRKELAEGHRPRPEGLRAGRRLPPHPRRRASARRQRRASRALRARRQNGRRRSAAPCSTCSATARKRAKIRPEKYVTDRSRPAHAQGHPRRTLQARPRPAPAVRGVQLRRRRGENGRPPARPEAPRHRHQRHRVRRLRGHRRAPGRPRPHQPDVATTS